MPSFTGKIILITGASSGIGAETAVQFAASGCGGLALVGRNKDNLDAVCQQCQEKGMPKEKVLGIIADMAKEEEVQRIMDSTIQQFGQLDVLVNNAGMGGVKSLADDDILTIYDTVIKVNVRSMLQLTQLAVPYLTKTKGSVVNNSSVCASRTLPTMISYNMSKAAVTQFTRCTALELAEKQIRVNEVNPGSILTPVHVKSGRADNVIETAKKVHALGRIGETSEVAKAILFLASDDASFITGTSLAVDGGRHIMCPR
ncbi:3-oxoacyl-[acyl-carrier-protein] reductase FabG-like [Asterias rubens]|uniref:3-oxoacyl-[acyl-carrier-protein] reductase FabG-like n=1 Tax=Asterias rubens TaxID=7604 RepID=UPI001455AD3C|nr:3-oxoacyl-[acyl-carrier-protein] reductase FabG-like [Asterias rubens]